jgi:hypothetical protein
VSVRRWAQFAATVAVAAITVTLAACTTAPAKPAPAQSPASTHSATPSATAAPPLKFLAGGSAEDNLEYFDLVNTTLLEGGNPGGRAIVDNLVAAGFDKTAMQVTADRTPLGSDVDSLQFSVKLGDECLVGQADAGGYVSVVVAALASGGCLVGNTRTIDW